MQSLFEIANASDAAFERLMNKHTAGGSQAAFAVKVDELKDEYLDDTELFTDVILDETCIDYDAFWATLRAMFNARKLKRKDSFEAFANSVCIEIECAIEKRAERDATK